MPKDAEKTEFYQHDQNWSNRMILGDSLQVMASLGQREGLRGKVQYIVIDPPYGIKFSSNFQWSTTSRDVKDGNIEHITREPEQVRAFRDTWRDGVHTYLTYLRDRLTVARDLLSQSGSVFVQIGDENVHRVREILEEVLGSDRANNVLPDALTVNFQAVTLSVTPDLATATARASVYPWPANLTVDNAVRLVRGSCRRGSGGVVVAMPDGPSGSRVSLAGSYASGCGPLNVMRVVMRAPDYA